jgi:hypothetical protein
MDFEQKTSVKKAKEEGENMTAEVIPDAHKPAGNGPRDRKAHRGIGLAGI